MARLHFSDIWFLVRYALSITLGMIPWLVGAALIGVGYVIAYFGDVLCGPFNWTRYYRFSAVVKATRAFLAAPTRLEGLRSAQREFMRRTRSLEDMGGDL